ncbi:MAG: hypothetical protein A2020_08590 [Lentisphaerae bacterium GWF2_45_14]|nr:MAG: hypothetical protein A2020_08590 [Lentisphaerae bacterium GWF2_45_14]
MLISVITAIIEIFGVFTIGAFARFKNYIKDEDISPWSMIIIDLLLPMLVFSSIVKDLDASRLKVLWMLPVTAFGIMASGAMLGTVLKLAMVNKGSGRMETFHHFCAINNYGFLPLIVISNIWGDKYLALLFLAGIGSDIGFWTIGVSLLGKGNIKSSLKKILSPNTIAIMAALLITVIGAKGLIPDVIIKIFSKLGGAAVPLMLMMIGASLYSSSTSIVKNKRDIAYLCFVRLLLIPFITTTVLKLLPIPEDAYRVLFVIAIMPVSVSSAILTRRFGGSPEFAGQAAIVTTVCSVATMPIMLMLLNVKIF